MAIEAYFKDIADAIRAKAGTSGLITPAQMPQAIANIQSGIEILHGTNDPSAAVGANGQIYLKHNSDTPIPTNLLASYQNIALWTKNRAAFTRHDVTYNDGVSTLIHTGGNGYERIFVPVDVAINTDYTFILKYRSGTNIPAGYDGSLAIAIATDDQTETGSSGSYTNLGKVNLDRIMSDVFSTYYINFNSGNYSRLYPLIDLNIRDGSTNTLVFESIYFIEGTYTEIPDPGRIVSCSAKVSGNWINITNAYIDDITLGG